ncbi:MAG: hypothetical protein KC441_18410 [Anaerolineales bacterium]|nr:hypothetical protein [Anaerolineales bacterium]MCA9972106.1 hypothetical protein [Anaerolineales bacterium]
MTYSPPDTRTQTRQPRNGHGMKPLAADLVHFHTQPLPEAVSQPDPFPSALWLGLWSSIVAGALVGLLFARLLFSGAIAPTGWEAIFSLGPVTFHAFWILFGAAAGLLLGGVSTLLATPRQET